MTLDELIEALTSLRDRRGNGLVHVEVAAMVYDQGPNAHAAPYSGELSAVDLERTSVRLIVDALSFDDECGGC
jgi:hypothetical protein